MIWDKIFFENSYTIEVRCFSNLLVSRNFFHVIHKNITWNTVWVMFYTEKKNLSDKETVSTPLGQDQS